MQPKLRLLDHNVRPEHRSGWKYAIESLAPLTCTDGVLTDTFLEASFVWHVGPMLARGELPYRRPWLGFLHNPVGIPEWHEYRSAPQVIFLQPTWRESLAACRGILTLSEDFASWVREQLNVPVLALIHPTEEPLKKFSWEAFEANPKKRVIQVGWWLRRMASIYRIPLQRLTPAVLEPLGAEKISQFDAVLEREVACLNLSPPGAVERIAYRPALGFDELLAENIVFADIMDATANNTVVECIVRHTPILVNPLPAVVEYLGAEYPLYFHSLPEAARKAEDNGCVNAAYQYLKEMPKAQFTGEHFCRSLAESKLYRAL
jgi:hypothetical protein